MALLHVDHLLLDTVLLEVSLQGLLHLLSLRGGFADVLTALNLQVLNSFADIFAFEEALVRLLLKHPMRSLHFLA